MKRILTLIMALAAFVAAESTADAQLLKNLLKQATTATETVAADEAATANGKAAGAALRSLYTQYKADGKKLDMSNLTNLVNLTTLSTNLQNLKGQPSKGAFYKDFVAGLISGSNNLVNEQNSTTVMDGLTSLVNNVDLSSLTSKAESTATAVDQKVTTATEKAATAATTAASSANEIASAVTNILNLFRYSG